MIDLYKVSKKWKTDGVWKIAPAGLHWIKEGSLVQIGEGSTIGEGSRIGEGSTIGEGSRIGEWSTIGKGSRIGEGSTIGANANEAIDLGWADGYRKCIAHIDGVAWIGAGCRWFTLADALKHWSAKEDRELTMCLMMAAVQIACFKNWSHE
jgi:NDP-sugar pyrophosphorylase family protein